MRAAAVVFGLGVVLSCLLAVVAVVAVVAVLTPSDAGANIGAGLLALPAIVLLVTGAVMFAVWLSGPDDWTWTPCRHP